jgi:hypothetical protein
VLALAVVLAACGSSDQVATVDGEAVTFDEVAALIPSEGDTVDTGIFARSLMLVISTLIMATSASISSMAASSMAGSSVSAPPQPESPSIPMKQTNRYDVNRVMISFLSCGFPHRGTCWKKERMKERMICGLCRLEQFVYR